MSWLTLAKTALKEAQKQIDKALDIQEVDVPEKEDGSTTANATTTTTTTTTTSSALTNQQPPPSANLPQTSQPDGPSAGSATPSPTLGNATDDVAGENAVRETATESTESGLAVSGTAELPAATDDAYTESQTVDSDSTQSFEDVQMLGSMMDSQNYMKPDFDSTKGAGAAQFKPQNCTSPPTSNDEIDTNTSSDIEIISNPNGDSSSTSTTRTSPQKLKEIAGNNSQMEFGTGTTTGKLSKKGHCREPSEISIISEDSQTEVDKLLHRISELNEIVETRELRLLQCERQNTDLQERNNDLQVQLDNLKSNSALAASSEEYTKRLSALEKKFQSSIRERDLLRTQIKALKEELRNKIPKDELERVVSENNVLTTELRSEGEKLSKDILQQSNIIKKLRSKEKSSDALLKKNKDQIADMSEELERLKKTLHAKDEVERTQIEVVHRLSSEKRKLEEESAQNISKIEDLQMKLSTLQTSFDAVKAELHQRSRLHSDLTRTTEEVLAAKKEKDITKAENHEIILQLNELREKLRSYEYETARKEQQLREDNKELLRRLEDAEIRAESSTQEINLTTIPLIRQLESLQSTLSQRTTNWNKEEKLLVEKLAKAELRLKSLQTVEESYKEKLDLLQVHCKELEEKLSESLMQEEKTKMLLQQLEINVNLKEVDFNKQLSLLNEQLRSVQEQNKSLQDKEVMEISFSTKTDSFNQIKMNEDVQYPDPERTQSPVVSCGINSLEEAMGVGIDWQPDDLETTSNFGRNASGFDQGLHINFTGLNTTTMEHLHSLLKQRDGELNHLQWDITRLQAERNMLSEEITNLTYELETVKEKLLCHEALENTYNELQQRYDALLQMYGEKVERTEELELDLTELKDAYKKQIDELLAQPR